MYDSEQFNGFVKNELDDLLFSDIWGYYVFNESDLHSSAYYYIRTYFQKRGSDNIYVRCEPNMYGKKPDIVIYDRGRPLYVLELKMFVDQERVDEAKIDKDIEKLNDFLSKIEKIKWGFFIFVYDSDYDFGISDPRLRRLGLENISVISLNMRRMEKTGRKRTRYDEWRKEFDRLRKYHNQW